MTQQEFTTEMNRLARVFGDNSYKAERITLIWKEMQFLPADAFGRVVDSLIGECRQAPLLKEFREFSAPEREKIRSVAKVIRFDDYSRVYDCTNCHDTGSILARRKDDKSPWAFKCTCPKGQQSDRNYPEWQSSYLNTMEIQK